MKYLAGLVASIALGIGIGLAAGANLGNFVGYTKIISGVSAVGCSVFCIMTWAIGTITNEDNTELSEMSGLLFGIYKGWPLGVVGGIAMGYYNLQLGTGLLGHIIGDPLPRLQTFIIREQALQLI